MTVKMIITWPKTCPSASISFSPERLLLRNPAPAPYIATCEISELEIIFGGFISILIERICLYLHLLGVFQYWVCHEAAQEETESEVLPEHLRRTVD